MTGLARILTVMPEAFAAVDAALGASSAASPDVLRQHLRRWRDERYPQLSDAECESLASCLHRNFYAR